MGMPFLTAGAAARMARGWRMFFYCAAALVLGEATAFGAAAAPEGVPGVECEISIREVIEADPPDSTIIDAQRVWLRFDRETTLRIGNLVLYLTASAVGSDGVLLNYSLYPFGQTAPPVFGELPVPYDVPVVLDAVSGKGKSIFRVLLTARAGTVYPTPPPAVSDEEGWRMVPSAYYLFHTPPFTLAEFHFPRVRVILDHEVDSIRAKFLFTAPGKINIYVLPTASDDFPYDPRYDFAVDPARNRIVVRYTDSSSGIDAQAILLLNLYRYWGYAPDLLAIGASGYFSLADYDVQQDRDAGAAIPLDSLAASMDFKRRDADAALHHAASFVRWLIDTEGLTRFRELYKRASDLSLHRAVWAGYGKTLAELEAEWLGYLKGRTFDSDEYHRHAHRARYYGWTERHTRLLEAAAASGGKVHPMVYLDLGQARGEHGDWEGAADAFSRLIELEPDVYRHYAVLGEAYWTMGDWVAAGLALNEARELGAEIGSVYLRLGEIQYEQHREDSAATLWQYGLTQQTSGFTVSEILLHLGRYKRRYGDAAGAREDFRGALMAASGLTDKMPAEPAVWYLIAESYLEMDSIDLALEHLEGARFLAHAPIDVGRIHWLTGACYDLAGRREDAVREYERVFEISATHTDRERARAYINKPYNNGSPR